MHEPVNCQRHRVWLPLRFRLWERNDLGHEFGGAVLQHLRRAIKNLAAIIRRSLAPTALRRPSRYDSIAEILREA